MASGPQCADLSWTLCDRNGYFFCLPGYTCYGANDGTRDGCGDPDYILQDGEYSVSFSSQLLATPTSATASFTTRSPDSVSSSPLASNLLLPSASSHAESSGESTSGQLSTSDIIAIAIGVSIGLVSFVGAYYTAIIY